MSKSVLFPCGQRLGGNGEFYCGRSDRWNIFTTGNKKWDIDQFCLSGDRNRFCDHRHCHGFHLGTTDLEHLVDVGPRD